MRLTAQDARTPFTGDESVGRSSDTGAHPPKGKRTVVSKYAKHACAQCRNAKAKCEGGKPICSRCRKTGHDCVWATEDARRPLTRARAQALTHQNTLLRAEVARLMHELAALRGDAVATAESSSLDPSGQSAVAGDGTAHQVSETLSQLGAGRTGPHVMCGLIPLDDIGEPAEMESTEPDSQLMDYHDNDDARELQDPAAIMVDFNGGNESEIDADMSAYESDGEGDGGESDEDDVGAALRAGGRTLFTEQDDLYMYGPTSVFRLRRRARRSESGIGSGSGIGSEDDSFSSAPEFSHARRGRRAKHVRRGAAPTRRTGPMHASPESSQRHILQTYDIDIRGTDATCTNCSCLHECWRRYLPMDVPLSRREHDTLLDRFFFFFSSWCMRAVPAFFLRDMYTFLHPPPTSTSWPRTAHYSPMLHNSLLAVASAFSASNSVNTPSARAAFASAAKALLEEECAAPRLATVQALGMLASFHSGRGEQTLGFMYFGMSVRIAQALGLGADCTPLLRAGRLRAAQVFDRAWAFHAGCAQDACWSLYVGRECGIALPVSPPSTAAVSQSDDASGQVAGKAKATASPVRMDDPFCLAAIAARDGIAEHLDRMAWRSPCNDGDAPLQCRTFTTFLWSCQLMKISRRIMDLMNRLTQIDNATEIKLLVTEIDMQLDQWRQDLPAELRLTSSNEHSALPHKLMMHIAFSWQHILLHRPFYQRSHGVRSVDSSFSINRCDLAARAILNATRLWRRLFGNVRYAPITLVQAIFAAGTIFILQAAHAARARRPALRAVSEAREAATELVGALRELSRAWECAARIADGFERLLKREEQGPAKEKAGASSRSRSLAKRRRVGEAQRMTPSEAEASVPAAAIEGECGPKQQLSSTSLDGNAEASSTFLTPPPLHSAGAASATGILPRTRSHAHSVTRSHAYRSRPVHPSVAQVLLSPTSPDERAYFSDIGSRSAFANTLRFGSVASNNGIGQGADTRFLSPKSAISFTSSGSGASLDSPSTSAWAWRGNSRMGYLSDDSYASDSAAGALSADEGQTLGEDPTCSWTDIFPSSTGLGSIGTETSGNGTLGVGSDSFNSDLLDLNLDWDLRKLFGLAEPGSQSAGSPVMMDMGFGLGMDAAMPGMGLLDPSGLGGHMNMEQDRPLPGKPASSNRISSSFESFSFGGSSTVKSAPRTNQAFADGAFSSDADDQAVSDSFFS